MINPKAAKRLRRGDNKPRTQTRNQLQAAPPTAPTPDFLVPDLQHSIARLDARIEHLRQQTRVLIDTDEPLINTTGIADADTIQLLGEPLLLPKEMQAKQWGAMAGLDPPQIQSGFNVNKKPPLQSRQLLLAYRPLYARSERCTP